VKKEQISGAKEEREGRESQQMRRCATRETETGETQERHRRAIMFSVKKRLEEERYFAQMAAQNHLHGATVRSLLEEIEAAMDLSADVNDLYDDVSALMNAVDDVERGMNGSTEVVDNNGKTAFDVCESDDCARLLLNALGVAEREAMVVRYDWLEGVMTVGEK
jgi:hypothetical protein